MKIFIKDFLAPVDRNDLIFGLKLDDGELYRVSNFQIFRAATSCLLILWNFTTSNENEIFWHSFLGLYEKKQFDGLKLNNGQINQ